MKRELNASAKSIDQVSPAQLAQAKLGRYFLFCGQFSEFQRTNLPYYSNKTNYMDP